MPCGIHILYQVPGWVPYLAPWYRAQSGTRQVYEYVRLAAVLTTEYSHRLSYS